MGGDLSSSLHPFCLSPQAQPRHLGLTLRDSFPREAPAKLWVWPFSGPHHTSQHCLLLALLVPICSFASWGLFLDLCCFFCARHSVFLNGTSLPSLFPWTNLSPERNFWPESLVPWQAAWGISFPLALLTPPRQLPSGRIHSTTPREAGQEATFSKDCLQWNLCCSGLNLHDPSNNRIV